MTKKEISELKKRFLGAKMAICDICKTQEVCTECVVYDVCLMSEKDEDGEYCWGATPDLWPISKQKQGI